ncbi:MULTISPECIES: arylsulfatase [Vibrio harveyi group]|uniref:Arylsulfatase n=1 Tax=Vibrio harveyi TaxID=669 RepID=A0ABN4KWY2_VIBHA|nr:MULTISPECIES: arylsulfatase [Vibrio harveyi group]AMF96253.1 arylsulfatase [Vibrio harveyi]EHE7895463.1 arylsulfatase [Vibrio parahaemolyticus]EKI0733630.1 arylsulfatase [Vibrio parahaemolyticus]MBE4439027.1 arylsulfatase [Vibrio parahaemolyticus]MEA5385576.1 arylsulfatase [Vibrio parahaemolyticus]
MQYSNSQVIKKTLLSTCILSSTICASFSAFAANKPNIVVIFGDDIGYWNLSSYNRGMLAYQTPNIDSIARDGALFTTYYAQQSSTAGRSAFITGQMPKRTGLSKVGMPGAPQGISKEDPTIATMLKELGYATGQFGKNHLGDRDEHLPTNHGFDEFFGNLYHLNAEEEPENEDYPKDPEFRKKYGPRGVIKSYADGRIEDTGSLTRKRMETVDDEFLDSALNFMERQVKADKPFFTWFNASRMHMRTHVPEGYKGKSGVGFYADGMLQHDDQVGVLLDKIRDLGIEDNTIVLYTTDNGPQIASWPDSGMTPFRSEKNTGWEGAFRVPALIKWPGHIKANTTFNGIVAGEDWFPTLLAAAGDDQVKKQLLKGKKVDGTSYKVHLDGYNQLPYLTGKVAQSPRKEFAYWSDAGDLMAIRYERWKIHFMIQERENGIDVWRYPLIKLRAPLIFDLSVDPFERGTSGTGYHDWAQDRAYLMSGLAPREVSKIMKTFNEFPPRMKAGNWIPETK